MENETRNRANGEGESKTLAAVNKMLKKAGDVKTQAEEVVRLLTIASFFPLIRERCIRRMMDRTKWIRDVSRVERGGGREEWEAARVYFSYDVSRALFHIRLQSLTRRREVYDI